MATYKLIFSCALILIFSCKGENVGHFNNYSDLSTLSITDADEMFCKPSLLDSLHLCKEIIYGTTDVKDCDCNSLPGEFLDLSKHTGDKLIKIIIVKGNNVFIPNGEESAVLFYKKSNSGLDTLDSLDRIY